jgi:hypothetical protein
VGNGEDQSVASRQLPEQRSQGLKSAAWLERSARGWVRGMMTVMSHLEGSTSDRPL